MADFVSTHLVLLGPMGVGKTTVGRLLATALERPFSDSDDAVERQAGLTSRQVAAAEGIAALHRLEADVFLAAAGGAPAGVIAPAASVVDDEACRAVLATQTCVLLGASPEILTVRTAGPRHRRSTHSDERDALLQRRVDTRRELSAFTVDASDAEPAAVVGLILTRIAAF
jgi:shikimate kinase